MPVAPDAAERQWQQTRWNLAGERCVFWGLFEGSGGEKLALDGSGSLSKLSEIQTLKKRVSLGVLSAFATAYSSYLGAAAAKNHRGSHLLQRSERLHAIDASSHRTALPALLSFDDI